jgi:ATP-binding cassette subfamily F protein 3
MPEATEAQKRAKTASFGFGAEKADTPSGNLSGGEKARLLFALATFHAPHLLLLDEPTNHLDVDSREALVHALNDYEGAVILISHDRHLIEATMDRLWLVRDGTATPYDGDLESYRLQCLSAKPGTSGRSGASPKPNAAKTAPDQKKAREGERKETASKRADLAPLKKRLLAAEKQIEALQKKIAAIDHALADPSLYAAPVDKSQTLTKERAQLARDLALSEEEWFSISTEYEQAIGAAA